MTTISTSDHLSLIKQFCERNLARNKSERAHMPEAERELAAARSGAAEAGWKATIAAIDYYIKCRTEYNWGSAHPVEVAVNAILAAYPLELLTT